MIQLASFTPGIPQMVLATDLSSGNAMEASALEHQPVPEPDSLQAQLQIGDFTLGDIDCPSLTGHPDIRY